MPRKQIILDDDSIVYDDWVADIFDYDEDEYDTLDDQDEEFIELFYTALVVDIFE